METLLVQVTERFAKASAMTVNALTGSNFTPKKIEYCDDGVVTQKRLIFSVAFTGTAMGEFIMAMDRKMADELARTDALDMFSEILNVVSGQAIQELSKVYKKLTLTSPRVIVGEVVYPRVRAAKALISGAHGDIECHLTLDHMQLELANAYVSALSTMEELETLGEEIVNKVTRHVTTVKANNPQPEEDDVTQPNIDFADVTKKIG